MYIIYIFSKKKYIYIKLKTRFSKYIYTQIIEHQKEKIKIKKLIWKIKKKVWFGVKYL